jgi:pimeloyl-ACP methyl ester carboxylesterase
MRSKYVQVDGVATNYFHTGPSTLPDIVPALDRGELLLFVHGAGWNANLWRRQLEHFGAQHSGVALDFPAHGRSGSFEGFHDLEHYANFLTAFVDALDLRPFVLVGADMGGAVAVEIAQSMPDKVRGLVLVSLPAQFDISEETIDVWHDVMRGRAQQPFSTELFAPKTDFSIMREVWMEQVKTDPRVRYFDLLACRDVDLSPALTQIRIPTLTVIGAEDQIVARAQADEVAKRVPDAGAVVIPNAGHSVSVERPEEFHQAVEDFLGGLG